MHRLLAPLVCTLLGLAGCGNASDGPEATTSTAPIDFLPGARVGELAEKELEAEHQEIAVGTVTCPDLTWQVDASVRCIKISELSDGRRVKIPGTVTVTSTENWGKLHVALDDQAAEFGLDGGYLNGKVTDWVAAKGEPPSAVDCPYLAGVVGTVVRCAVRLADAHRVVLATVTVVDPDEFRTHYSLSWVTP